MANNNIWSKLKKAFSKQTASNLKKDSGKTSTKKKTTTKSKTSTETNTTRNAYKSAYELQQNKIQQAFKADQQEKLKKSAETSSQRKEQRTTQKNNAIKNDVKASFNKSNQQKKKTQNSSQEAQARNKAWEKSVEKEREKVLGNKYKVQKEWDSEAKKLAKSQGYSSVGQARKQGSKEMTALDIKYGQKKNDVLYSGLKGTASGLSAGLTDLSKYAVAPEIRSALEEAEANQTQAGKRAETLSNIGASFVGIGATAGLSKKVGEATLKGAGSMFGRDLSEEAIVSRLAPILEKKAAKLSAKKGVEITGKDLAKSMFAEYAQDIGMNVGGWGQAQAISDAVKAKENGESGTMAYAKAQALNILMGVPVNNFVAGRGAINEARIASKADDILNPDYNLYLKDGEDIGYHDEFNKLTNELSALEAKGKKRKSDKVRIDEINKRLNKLKTENEWNTFDEEKALKLQKAEEDRLNKGYASQEAQNRARLQKPKGQRIADEALAEKDKTTDYVKNEAVSYTDLKKHKKLYESHRAIDNNGNRLSQTAYTSFMYTKNKKARDKIVDDMLKGKFQYGVEGNERNIREAVERLSQNPQAIFDEASRIANGGDWSGRGSLKREYDFYSALSFVQSHLDDTKISAKDRKAYLKIYSDLQIALKDISSVSGQNLQLRRIFVHTVPEYRAKIAIRDAASLLARNKAFLNSSGINYKNMSKKELLNAVQEYIYKNKKFDAPLDKLWKAVSEEEVSTAYDEVIKEAMSLMKPSTVEVIQAWRYLSMLGNPKTHGRNMIGNGVFGAVREFSDTLGSVAEDILIKTGLVDSKYVRSKAKFNPTAWAESFKKEPTTQAGKDAKDLWDKFFKEYFGTNQKFDAQLIRNMGISEKNLPIRALNWLSDKNSKLLEKEDYLAMEHKFREIYAKVAEANGLYKEGANVNEALKEKINNIAIDEAIRTTFREPSEFATVMNKLSKKLTDPTASFGERSLALIANTMMPFAKTPANVLKQAVNFSPVGLVKGSVTINKALKSGDPQNIYRAVEDLCAGLTGTGIALVGFYFGRNSDLVTASIRDNNAGDKFAKNNGKQSYSIQIGDHSFTLDWLTPTVSSFFAGVQAAKNLEDLEGKTGFDYAQDMEKFISSVFMPVIETSMLSGLKNTFDAVANDYSGSGSSGLERGMLSIAENYANSLVPTLVGQASRTAYGADKQVVGSTDIEYALNNLKNKAGLANIGKNPLGDATDAYGNVKNKKETAGDYAMSALKNFIIPTNIQKVTLTDEDKKMIDIYNKAIKAGMDSQQAAMMFPKQSFVREFVVGKKASGQTEVTMTNKVLSTYNQAKTHAGKEAYKALMSSKYFDGYSKEEKQSFINSAPTTLQEAVGQIIKMPEVKNLSAEEQSKLLARVINTGGDKAIGSIKEQELTAWKALGKSETNYLFKNDLTARLQNNYKQYKDVVSKEDFLWFSENALSDKDTYTKESMLTALALRDDLTEEQKAALYNSFKNSKAKEYGASGSGSGSGSSKKSTTKIDTSAYKTKKFTPKSSKTTSKGYTLEVKSNYDSKKKAPPTLEKFKI